MGQRDRRHEPSVDDRNAEDEAALDELSQVVQWYAQQPDPQPTPELTQRLMARLQEEAVTGAHTATLPSQSIKQTLRMARWQLTLLGPWFWITGAVLLALGVSAGPLLPHGEAVTLLIYVLPLTAVLSAVYALRRVRPGIRDLEKSSPTGFVEMMAGVILALVCFNMVLGSLATAALSLTHWAAFAAVVMSWLGPLLLLVAISFPVALRWGAWPAMLVGGCPWLLLLIVAAANAGSFSATVLVAPQPDLLFSLQLGAAALGGFTLFLLLARGSTWQRFLVLG